MGSTRLPGKVMMEICGRPMLWHVIHRLRHAERLDSIVVATSEQMIDDEIEEFCRAEKVPCFRGSEKDVLDRYYQAAKWIGADVIVRITADCPLIDPEVVDSVVNKYLECECDYASNSELRTYPDGLDTEVFSFNALKRAWSEARMMSEREHVTPYIRNNKIIFTSADVFQERDLSTLRWTVDEPEDIEFVRNIYERLYRSDRVFLMDEVVNLLREDPKLLEINKGFERNEGYLRSLREDFAVDFPDKSD
jgi:spore coat polysaccharide biosynthesis protein SpsF (cytidylyltransferase family)